MNEEPECLSGLPLTVSGNTGEDGAGGVWSNPLLSSLLSADGVVPVHLDGEWLILSEEVMAIFRTKRPFVVEYEAHVDRDHPHPGKVISTKLTDGAVTVTLASHPTSKTAVLVDVYVTSEPEEGREGQEVWVPLPQYRLAPGERSKRVHVDGEGLYRVELIAESDTGRADVTCRVASVSETDVALGG